MGLASSSDWPSALALALTSDLGNGEGREGGGGGGNQEKGGDGRNLGQREEGRELPAVGLDVATDAAE